MSNEDVFYPEELPAFIKELLNFVKSIKSSTRLTAAS